jgi:hypothetical protein
MLENPYSLHSAAGKDFEFEAPNDSFTKSMKESARQLGVDIQEE